MILCPRQEPEQICDARYGYNAGSNWGKTSLAGAPGREGCPSRRSRAVLGWPGAQPGSGSMRRCGGRSVSSEAPRVVLDDRQRAPGRPMWTAAWVLFERLVERDESLLQPEDGR